MNRISLLFLFIILASLVGNSAVSGELSDDLVNIISRKQSNELQKVWIKLPRTEDSRQFKTTLAATFSTRRERHTNAIKQLKNKHTTAQQFLLTHLDSLKKSSKVKKVKAHWIVNLIEAEVTVEQLSQLASRDDIETIYPVPEITGIVPDETKQAPKLSAGVESNLTYINAPAAWAAGFTGKGRIICSFDTGVDGNHPALYNNWKGHDGDSSAAWFDPVNNEPFPHYVPDCIGSLCLSHGTKSMGLMVGHDDNTQDTIGVAPDARWISAAVIDILGTSIIDAFEWAADPDSNPNSLDDVPDVINHSWGVPFIDCQNVFYDIIDNIEALGIVNIFAAGNSGSNASTILNPANRANDSLDCFAVGNINQNDNTIMFNSSRGPSDCNIGAIKPNVVAPGNGVRSSSINGSYGGFSGTSAAAPHVSGLVALLREKNPNATVDDIKEAILTSTDTLGYNLPDNDLGWGLIDCMAALNALSGNNTSPNVRVYAFDHAPINSGDTVLGTVILKNLGASVSNITAALANNNGALNVLDGFASFGSINEGDTVRSVNILRIMVADTVTEGTILSLDFNITNNAGYSTVEKLYFLIEPKTQRSFITHNVGNTEFSLTNFGTFGLGDNSFFPAGGSGFKYQGGINDLYEGGLMIGIGSIGSFKLSDGVRNVAGEPDGDFKVLPGGNIKFVTPLSSVSQQSFSRFSDERAENPIGIEIIQNSYVYDYSPYQDFIILQYIIKNNNLTSLNNLYIGLYLDWDITNYLLNAGGYESSDSFAWIAYNNGSTLSNYRGVKVVDGNIVTAYTEKATVVYFPNPITGLGGDGYTETEKMISLATGFGSSDSLKNIATDLFQVVAVRTDLASGQIDTVAFAILAGANFVNIQNSALESVNAYLLGLTDTSDDNNELPLPEEFVLHQNYPNPFNSTTTISFNLKRNSNYTLTIYNLEGRKVHEVKGKAKAGGVSIVWDADDNEVASGVYLYRLTAGNFTDSKKMVLLK